jgi:hypothetical protein
LEDNEFADFEEFDDGGLGGAADAVPSTTPAPPAAAAAGDDSKEDDVNGKARGGKDAKDEFGDEDDETTVEVREVVISPKQTTDSVKAPNFGPLFQKGLLSLKCVLQKNEANKSCRKNFRSTNPVLFIFFT